MDRALIERLIGAAILVVVVVVLAPALLDGVQDSAEPLIVGSESDTRRATKVVVLKTPQRKGGVAASAAPAIAPAAGPSKPPTQTPDILAPSPPPRTAPPPGFAVQLGSFAERANAERYAAKVSAEGFDVFVVRAAADALQVYRVYVGPEDSRERAGRLADQLQGKGHSVMIVELDGKRG